MQINKRNGFFVGWLALGAIQLLSETGCAPAAPTSEAQAAGQSGVLSVGEENVGEAKLPVRIPRRLFEEPGSSPEGQVVVSGQTALDSRLGWRAVPAEGTPAAGALADFSDTRGCLEFSEASDERAPAICFRVMPDVSSVALNSKDSWLKNPGQIPAVASACPELQRTPEKVFALESSNRESTGDRQAYRAVYADATGECPTRVEVSLRF